MGKMLERMSRFSFRRANRIIALDRFMRDRIKAKGIAPEKIAVIPPWSQDNDVRYDEAGREQFRKAHGLAGKFVVMYAGNHSPVHPLDTLMQAAERLKDDPSIAFCFIGGGSEFKRVQRWAEERGNAERGVRIADGKNEKPEDKNEFQLSAFPVSTFKNVLCLPYQPLNQLSASLSAADAHAIIMGAAMLGLVHPCKIYNALAVQAPIIYIGPKPGHVTEILDRLGDKYPSIRVAHGEADILAEQIQELRQKTAGGRGSLPVKVTTTFSKGVLLPELIAALEELRDD
jgi:glycosyltransferase involved in cell wall biosynthesis